MHFFMALAATSLLPAVYFIKTSTHLWQSGSQGLNVVLDLLVFLGLPLLLSFLSLLWIKSQAADSIANKVNEISPVNNDYLPVYLGYIFVSLSIPADTTGGIDWISLSVVYCWVCLLFILFGYGYYKVKTSNNVKVFVITKREIRKNENEISFSNLRKINELVYLDVEKYKMK